MDYCLTSNLLLQGRKAASLTTLIRLLPSLWNMACLPPPFYHYVPPHPTPLSTASSPPSSSTGECWTFSPLLISLHRRLRDDTGWKHSLASPVVLILNILHWFRNELQWNKPTPEEGPGWIHSSMSKCLTISTHTLIKVNRNSRRTLSHIGSRHKELSRQVTVNLFSTARNEEKK